jgi:hypothetical protein
MVTEKHLLALYENGMEQGINPSVILCSLSGYKAWKVVRWLSFEILTAVFREVMPSG